MYLVVDGLTKTYGEFTVLDNVSLSVESSEFVCLLGPSGCGKTTLLRIIAGLTEADRGVIRLQGSDLAPLPARRRGFGIVFQSYSLFPNMTARENIGYGLKIRGVDGRTVAKRVDELLEIIKLSAIADRFPWQLSGGQQQRVALARAIAVDPRVLLLDEPLSALDAKVRAGLRQEIREVQRALRIPTLMVTHDQDEALSLADRIVCMNHGVIEQCGTPEDLYHTPATRFVADFIGISNLIGTDVVRSCAPELLRTRPDGADEDFVACLRPEKISLSSSPAGKGTVRQVTFLGNLTRVQLDWADTRLTAEVHGDFAFKPGETVDVVVDARDCAWVRNA